MQLYQNNTLQTLKRQRAQYLWKELIPQGFIFLVLGCFCLRLHFFIWWCFVPFSKGFQKKLEKLTQLNTEIKQHIAQSGFRIEDEYPPRMVGP